MELGVRLLPDRPHTLEAGYDCPCGCKPRARYQRGSDDAGSEHCCCGQVLFVGARAHQRLQAYLAQRRAQGLDANVHYTFQSGQIQTPWGEGVAWAHALPDTPQEH